MPAPSFIIFFGAEILFFYILGKLGFKTPFQMSSLKKGFPIRPITYTILEDVIAVDTGKGRAYREAINARYEASHRFRELLHRVDLFWSIPALLVGIGCTIVIALPEVPETIGYGIGTSWPVAECCSLLIEGLGWGVPPLWTCSWVVITTFSVQHYLRKEKEEWYKGSTV